MITTHTTDELGTSQMEQWLVNTVGIARITWYKDTNNQPVVNFDYGEPDAPVTYTAQHADQVAYDDVAHTVTVTPT